MSADRDLASASRAAVEVLHALSAGWVQILDGGVARDLGLENAVGEVPNGTETLPWRAPVVTAHLLVVGVGTPSDATAIAGWLQRFYPASLPVTIVEPGAETRVVRLDAVGGEQWSPGAGILVPPLSENDNVRTFAGMMQLTRRLRGPGGCPWDREQTHDSLKPHLLEETYEVLDALDSGDADAMAEEFGDLLYQITLHSQVAAEAGEFAVEDVIQNIVVKLIGRHPHVFGDARLESAQDVREAWESLKQRQKPKRTSIFEGIPRGLPALPQSNLMQKRAASVGFEWVSVLDVLDKVEEEIRELREEINAGNLRERQREELGDLLFALVSVARHLKLDPEEALRLANGKFAARFQHVEASARAEGKSLRDLTAAELDRLWSAAKTQEQA